MTESSNVNFAKWCPLALVAWLMAGAYLQFPLAVGGTVVSSFMIMAAAPIMALLFWRDLRRSDLVFFGSLLILSLVSIVFSPGFEFLSEKLKGAAHLVFFCGLMILLIKLCKRIGGRAMYWFFLVATLTIATGLLLEFFLPGVKAVGDQVRNTLYADYEAKHGFSIVYQSDGTRDVEMVGRDRANFFASEPSVAAAGIMIFGICCLVLRQDTKTIAAFVYANCCGLLTTGSPVIPISLVAGLIILVRFNLRRKPSILIAGLALIALSFALPSVRSVIAKQTERFTDGIDGYGDMSLYSRLGVPYFERLPEIARQAPLFGVGAGGKEVLVRWARPLVEVDSLEFVLGTNAFVLVFLYYGILGGVLYYWLFYRYLGANQIRFRIVFAIVWVAYANTSGGLEEPTIWIYSGFLVSAFWFRSHDNIQFVDPTSALYLSENASPLENASYLPQREVAVHDAPVLGSI